MLSLCLCLASVACGGPRTQAPVAPSDDGAGDAQPEVVRRLTEPPTVAAGATVVQVACAEGAAEACNAVDDDCDGVVDEGCGYASGPIQVTVAWNSDADLDLYVVDPGEETVSFQRREGATGATMDHVARGACVAADGESAEGGEQRVENVYWNRLPPQGEYRVELHYLFECDTDAGPTTATVSVSVSGAVVGAYNLTLTPTQRETVVRFTLE